MNSYPLTLETLPCSSCTLPLFRTDFILKNVTRNKEKVLINGMKIWVFEPTYYLEEIGRIGLRLEGIRV